MSQMIFKEVEDLAKMFESCAEESQLMKISENLFGLLGKIKESGRNDQTMSNYHSLGIRLWNLVITKSTTPLVSAKVRHVGLQMTFMANFQDKSITSSRKQQAMAMKVGRDWLDCNDLENADICFKLSSECYMKLEELLKEKNTLTKDQLLEVQRNMLKVNAFRAEVALGQNQHATAFEYVNKAKATLSNGDIEMCSFLRSVCYNFGLECYQKELYQQAELWLRESLLMGEERDKEKQGTVEQLLGMVYISIGDSESLNKALQILESALKVDSSFKCIFMKLRVMVLLEEEEGSILKEFLELIKTEACDLDFALQCISLFAENKRLGLCERGLEQMTVRFVDAKQNLRIQLKRLELLLSCGEVVRGKEIVCSKLLTTPGTTFDRVTIKRLELLLWEQAQNSYEAKDFLESLCWYKYSLKFMTRFNDDKSNLSKLKRNICACQIELQLFQEALSTAEEGVQLDSTSPQIHFLLLKIHLHLSNQNSAIESLEKLSLLGLESNSNVVSSLIHVAAQLAFENGNREISEVALEKLIVFAKDQPKTLTAIRCLARLKFTYLSDESKEEDVVKVLQLIEKAYDILLKYCEEEKSMEMKEEIVWFNKLAWNVSLSCSNNNEQMQTAFTFCYKFSQLLPTEEQNLIQQKTSFLMAAGCAVQVARKSNQTEKLEEVLDMVDRCTKALNKMPYNEKDTTANFLLMYEFEANLRLTRLSEIDHLLERALQIANVKLFENLSGISMNLSHNDVTIKCLKLTIKSHLEQPTIDYPNLSKAVHSLINVSLQSGSNTNAESKEDAFTFYNDTLKIIQEDKQGDYPEMELVWLMTKAWNCGIHLYSGHSFEHSEQWCSLAMKFLKHLTDLKPTYESHMTGVFAEVVSAIQKSRAKSQIEE